MLKRILHANDGSKCAFRALALALDLAKRNHGIVHVVSVEETQYLPGTREEVIGEKELQNHRFEGVIQKEKEEANKQGVELETHLLVGHPVKAIAEFAKDNAFDALVVG